MTSPSKHTSPHEHSRTALPPWLGGAIFLGSFLATSLAFTVLASRPLPLPTANYYGNEQSALWVAGACQLLFTSALVILFRCTLRRHR